MKQTFVPILLLLFVMLLLFAYLYFLDQGQQNNTKHPEAKRVRIGIIDSSLKWTDTAVLDSSRV